MNVTLITGASGGIGKAMATLWAKNGHNLLLVARNLDALHTVKDALEAEHGVSVWVYGQDLTDPAGPDNLFAFTQEQGLVVDYLINNAGFGLYGNFYEQEFTKLHAMMQLNMHALTRLTHLFLPAMVAAKSGTVLNVASTAGFLPGPLQAVYFATKAYVLSLSEAIAEEVKQHNVQVTALCPGPVATEFATAANMKDADMFKHAQSPQSVAKQAYYGALNKKRVIITQSTLSFLLRVVLPLVPRSLRAKMVKKMQQQ